VSEPVQTSPFRIRPARRGDAEAVKSLIAELGYSKGGDVQTVNWIISHPEMEMFVAADPLDKAIGVISLSHRPQLRLQGRVATLDELVVSAAWRRRGVGRALVKRAVERAKVLSVKRVEIVAPQVLAQVPREFYAACGFSEATATVLRLDELDPR
jgi:N-acetylglutamate synthase-like GNAT family acetyltransferase